MQIRRRSIALIATSLIGLAVVAPAQAGTGCNSVVNIFVWGCAPWDNNTGSKFPYFRKRVIEIPKKDAQVVSKNGSNAVLYQGTYYPLISQDGGGLVASGAGNFKVYQQQ